MPAVKKSAIEVDGEANSSNSEFVTKTVENNVLLTIDRIREKSQILSEMEDNGEIKIVGEKSLVLEILQVYKVYFLLTPLLP